jgi:molybdate transport system ATP-binding protein
MLAFDGIRLPLAHFDLDVTFETTERSAGIFGPSGSGKTTILELIAGVRRPSSGRITIDGADVTRVRARDRRVGYVPQGDSLFPHLSVEANIRYGLRDDAQLKHVIDVLEIAPLLDRGVIALSGGEGKRVALARALVTAPRLLLLDEPLAGLDRPLHARVLDFLVRVRDELRVPLIYVTHDPVELRTIVRETIVIERGRVIRTSLGDE